MSVQLPFFTFREKESLDDYGIYLTSKPSIPSAEENVQAIEVSGRSGSLTMKDGSYKDIEVTVGIRFRYTGDSTQDKFTLIHDWLSGAGDLIFNEVDNYILKVKTIRPLIWTYNPTILQYSTQVTFVCYPFKVGALTTYPLTKPQYIFNEGTRKAAPIIKVFGKGDINLSINNQTVVLKGVEDYITIDCNQMNAFKDTKPQNNKMFSPFPFLEVGRNYISWTGNVTKVELTNQSQFK
ncbi:phage tail protein [Bacillus pseudomycoides]|nr:phage tail protein [Bacillus pseudomycoides]